nr:hypothetical protein [Allomuricauda sp.]
MTPVTINFNLTQEQAETVMEVLSTISQSTNNKKVRAVTKHLLQNVKKDVWSKHYTTKLMIDLLTKKTGKIGIHENSSLKNYLQLNAHTMTYFVPKWCNTVLIKTSKDGNLGQPKNLITSKIIAAKKPTKVKDLVKIVINELR